MSGNAQIDPVVTPTLAILGSPLPCPGLGPLRQSIGHQILAYRFLEGELSRGKYLVGWMLGVPVFVLVIVYFFMR